RLKAFFSDFAKEEPKPLRIAFERCIEANAYFALKSASDGVKRVSRKVEIAQRVRNEHGLDTTLCAEALDILEAALFGTVSTADYDNKEYTNAITDLNEALKLDPNFAFAYFNRGSAYNSKSNYDHAIADYNEALRLVKHR
ncbi:MAG: tetratricopeptide repeat protein, partial [Spirochaetaceae bacterium]|nr:tetratricopeptide repeat protein [Spirochaetaceae bacterium]